MKEIDEKEPRNNGGPETLFFLFILVFFCQMKRTSKLGGKKVGKETLLAQGTQGKKKVRH